MNDPNTQEQTDQPETEPPHEDAEEATQPAVPDAVLEFFRRYDKLIMGVTAIVMALAAVAAILMALAQGSSDDSSPERFYVPAPAGPLSMVSQVKQNGVKLWADTVTILPGDERVRYRLRVENTGSKPLTGVVARAEMPEPIAAMPGKCWRRFESCEGSPVEDGVELPDLEPGEWDFVVFVADVSEDIHGGRYQATLKISSDQTGELVEWVAVVVSTSSAENAVRPFFQRVEETLEFRDQPVEMALHSKRLLIGQWPNLTLDRPHSFDRAPRARALLEGKSITIDDLHYERRLEGQVVKVRGRVLERPIDYRVNTGVVEQRVELGANGQGTRLHCYTARDRSHLLGEGDEVEVKVVIVAWGSPGSPSRDLTVAVCPAMRLLKRFHP